MASALMSKTALAGQALVAKTRAARPQAPRSSLVVRAAAKAGNWLPGSDTPDYLDGLPASYGFDPLGLGKTDSSLERFTEAEIINGRWAMLGVAGALAPEVLGLGDWYSAPLPAINGEPLTYFGVPVPFSLETLLAIEFVAMAGAESYRGAQEDPEKRKYPGGAFDPMGLSKGNLDELKLKELKNGRLAMVAFVGFFAQHAATGKTPLQALGAHVADPWNANFATNGVSLPF
jgi:light-harvesting complex I chlorophyll a/b binding protein 1